MDDPLEKQKEAIQKIEGVLTPGAPEDDPIAKSAAPDPDPRSFRAWLIFRLSLMLVVTAGLLWVLFAFGPRNLVVGALVLLGLGFVIFIHELGHFAVAKWCDVYVETFSIGFGPALPGCSYKKGETTYMVGFIPLGGYVKMLGEGAEDDPEGEEDNPRSFKNKSVPQRMAIISAGVIMNVIFGCIAFIIVYMFHGERQFVGAVGMVDSGSPAWIKGAESGYILYQIGDKDKPTFNDLKAIVPLAGTEKMPIVFGAPGKPEIKTTIEPRRSADDKFPMIGLGPATSLALPPDPGKAGGLREGPFWTGSAAAGAQPPFKYGDTILAMTDPADPSKVTELPNNLRNPDSKMKDYYVFRERLQQLKGKGVTVEVERSNGEKLNIHLPPAYHSSLGLRMKMGRVNAVRPLKGGAENPIQFKNQVVNNEKVSGDIIKAVEVVEPAGFRTRWVLDHTPLTSKPVNSSSSVASLIGLAAGTDGASLGAGLAPMIVLSPTIVDGVIEKDLDPFRLPYELDQWAQRRGSAKTVKVTVGRTVDKKEDQSTDFELPWDDEYRYSQEVPLGLSSPLSIPGLGIAYHVETTVEAVHPNSPATRARITLAAEGEGQHAAAPWYRSPMMLLVVGIVFLVLVGVSRTGDSRVSIGLGILATVVFAFGLYQMLRTETPAEQAKRVSPFALQKGDVITEVRFFHPNATKPGAPPEPDRKPIELKQYQWANAFWQLQMAQTEVKQLGLKVERLEGGKPTTYRDIVIEAEPDTSWPMVDRGLAFMPDTRMKRADGLGEAIGMGYTKTVNFIGMVYQMLRRLVTGDIAPDNIGGPLMIFMTGKDILDYDVFEFLLFLGMISVNLAVVNFLPIPVLDGGHFVFLLYEGLRGKPASEKVRIATTYVGLILIITLMGFVIWMDVKRYFL